MIFVFCFLVSGFAQESSRITLPDVVVTPNNRFYSPAPDAVVNLSNRSAPNSVALDEILREAPGAVVSRAGGTGQPSSLFLRGSASEHALVLIDGIEVNDPSQPTGGFDFSTLDTNLVERIEIFNGPQALRFGAGALGGVVNIVTKKGRGAKRIAATLKAGSFATHSETVSVTGENFGTQYAAAITRFETEGISAARGGEELDGHHLWSAALKLSRNSRMGEWELVHRTLSSRSDLDYAPSPSGPYFLAADDSNYFVTQLQLLNGLKNHWQGEHWTSDFTLSHFYQARHYENKPDVANADRFLDHRYSNTFKIEQILTKRLTTSSVVSLGPSIRVENSKYQESIAGAFANYSYAKNWRLDGGLRYDHHSRFGSQLTYALAPGYKFSATAVGVRFATAFKAPSLFQIHDPRFGNSGLKAEKVAGTDAFIEQFLGEEHSLRLTTFDYRFFDLIEFSTRYQNLSEANIRGAELAYTATLERGFETTAVYTYTDARNPATGRRLLRRPLSSFRIAGSWPFAERWAVRAEYRGVGARPDIDALSAAAVTTAAYDVLNCSLNHELDRLTLLSVSVENAFGKSYEEVAGYGAPGFGIYAGLRREL